MNFKAVFYLLGRLLCLIALFLLFPAAISFYHHEANTASVFLVTAALSLVTGIIWLVQGKETKEQGITIKDSFLLVALAWLFVSIIGALPYYFTRTIPHFMDAFFESVSGFTTTGATILPDVEYLDWGLLFWRSLTQWIGGMGIIVLAVAILPQLSVGGLQMMKNEMPGPSFEQIKPRIKQTALSLWKIYFLFSGLAFVAYLAAGMPWFDALCHMFSSLGTGGFSTKNASFAAFGPTVQMLAVFFMLIGATSFVLHYSWIRGDFKKLFSNSEWKFFMGVLLFCTAAITCELTFRMELPVLTALRISIFHHLKTPYRQLR